MMVPGGGLLIGPKPPLPVKRQGQARHPDPEFPAQARHPRDLAGLHMFPDNRLLAGALFSDIDRIAGIAGGSSHLATRTRHRAG
jgi:hypothetical protein